MKKYSHPLTPVILLGICLMALITSVAAGTPSARNVIIMIGDGMGPTSVAQAHYYKLGMERSTAGERLSMESLPVMGLAYTHCLDDLVTDSAASATALCTGHKAKRYQLSITPDGRPLTTIFEVAARAGKATGVVTTVPITHATPAAAYAHIADRNDYHAIFDWLLKTHLSLVMGAGVEAEHHYLPADFATRAREAGYTVCRTPAELAKNRSLPLLAVFDGTRLPFEWDRRNQPSTAPHLTDLTDAALERLGSSPNGFVLMIEGGSIDWANHDNQQHQAVFETLEFDRSVQHVIQWVEKHSSWHDTLLVVTADHDCGQPAVLPPTKAPGKEDGTPDRVIAPGEFAGCRYITGDHTAAPVPVYSAGPGSDRLAGPMDNTHIARIIRMVLGLDK